MSTTVSRSARAKMQKRTTRGDRWAEDPRKGVGTKDIRDEAGGLTGYVPVAGGSKHLLQQLVGEDKFGDDLARLDRNGGRQGAPSFIGALTDSEDLDMLVEHAERYEEPYRTNVLCAAVLNPHLGADAIDGLIGERPDNPTLVNNLWAHPNCDPGRRPDMGEDGDEDAQTGWLANQNRTAEELGEYADDPRFQPLVIANPHSSPQDILRIWDTTESSDVRRQVLSERSDLPERVYHEAATSEDWTLRYTVAQNPRLPVRDQMLLFGSKRPGESYDTPLARNPGLDPGLLRLIANSPEFGSKASTYAREACELRGIDWKE